MKLLYTNDNCVGCNKCIKACSCMGACISTEPDEEGNSRIIVDNDRCVACGACFDACEHNAREYNDDTDAFFEALAGGEPISVLIAPSFRANYPNEYEKVLGGLKALGVNRFINVAFGADISTWGYIRLIKEQGFVGGISQPCPAVVNYIEKYMPELIPMLFPIQSPLMCAAIYARKELGITDRFAFISPCIAKRIEIRDPKNEGLVSYNVTFSHLMKYIKEHDISGEPCGDEVEYGFGTVYPMPGGLADYVKWLLGEGAFVRHVEGEKRLYRYLKQNASKIAAKKTNFLLIDALNCENGCLCGTAVDPVLSETDNALFELLRIREEVKSDEAGTDTSRPATPAERFQALNDRFLGLDLSDYLCGYTDRSKECPVKIPNERELDHIFYLLGKETKEDREINCTACGYDTCRDMAIAIYNGFNHCENCVHYLKQLVEQEQEMLRYYATYDYMLGIWNRRYANEYIAEHLTKMDEFSVLMADIDDFKGINVTYGHAVADRVIRQVSYELKLYTENRGWWLARYGGDQFMIIIHDRNVDENHESIDEIDRICSMPVEVPGKELHITVSIGIANADDVTPVESLLLNAETAMYEAKEKGRRHVFVYSEQLKQRDREEEVIRGKILEAFDNDGFHMVYQPQVDTKTREVRGYEALIRMKAPGMFPDKFIPVAEKNGWIWRIGRSTTELVVRQLAEWREQGYPLVPVSINFSSVQLNDEGYVDYLEELLEEYDIPAEYIEIEITEGIFLERTEQATSLFQRFEELGIRLLMDDFGTGYSSLGYLTYIPVDVIKLDKSLVDAYLVEGKSEFINDVIRLVHDLDKEMVVEGVEEKWQYEKLLEFGADTIQGYYFSRPLPPEEAISFKVDKAG